MGDKMNNGSIEKQTHINNDLKLISQDLEKVLENLDDCFLETNNNLNINNEMVYEKELKNCRKAIDDINEKIKTGVLI